MICALCLHRIGFGSRRIAKALGYSSPASGLRILRKLGVPAKPASCKKPARVCVVCGAEFTRRAKNNSADLCCSRECGFVYLRRTRWAKKPEEVTPVEPVLINHPRPMKVFVCKTCGHAFIRKHAHAGSYKYCGDDCSLKGLKESRRKAKRAIRARTGSQSTHRKRAKRYGCFISRVDRIKLFNDSKWTCRCCGVSTPREAMGKQQPNSPEMDHIIPLSKGGAHAQSNVQLLCRACNSAKGAKVAA